MVVIMAACSPKSYLETGLPYKNTIYLSTDTSQTHAHVYQGGRQVLLNDTLTYYSYRADRIHATRGGLAGKPLHGLYTEQYADGALKSQGTFYYGLRQGEWRYWRPDGSLRETTTWKIGIQTGRFYKYSENGQLLQRGRLKSGRPVDPDSVWWKRLINKRRSR